MEKTTVARGQFALEQRQTAPPWSGSWFTTAAITADHEAALDFSEICCVRTSDDGQSDHSKKKLFVGMAPKAAYEEDYREVFTPFGTLVDIYVIRDRNGFSKGCAFVKYDSVKSAQHAIDALHDKYVMPGGFRTLVVTIADDRRSSHCATSTWQGADQGSRGRGCCDLFRMDNRSPGSDSCGVECWRGQVAASIPSLQAIAAPHAGYAIPAAKPSTTSPTSPMVHGMPYIFCGGSAPHGTYMYCPCGMPSKSPQQTPSLATIGVGNVNPPRTCAVGPGPVAAIDAGMNLWCDGGRTMERYLASTSSGVTQKIAFQHGSTHSGEHKVPYYEAERSSARKLGIIGPETEGRRWAKQPVGPHGANLFVYYLPGSLSDADLATAFSPFGEVLSAKVYYDRETGESKGFGFVSYTDPSDADTAIARMNGFFIGHKRLKVVRKRGQVAAAVKNGWDGGSSTRAIGQSYLRSVICPVGSSVSVGDDGPDMVERNETGGDKSAAVRDEGEFRPLVGQSLDPDFLSPQDFLDQQLSRPASPLQYL